MPAATWLFPAGKFRAALLDWYGRHRRELPWRLKVADPYRVWLSEIMLQQTRAAAVIPYFHRFLDRFPTLKRLAEAPESEVLAAWAGLGYYSRARNLQRAARAIVAEHAQVFPSAYDAIRALPGIGDYTAAAVASIAFSLPHAVVDGNVIRVLTRVAGDDGDIGSTAVRRRIEQHATALLSRTRPGDWNQALMELGATVCTPKAPRCAQCPVAPWCMARATGRQRELPVKAKKPAVTQISETLLVIPRGSRILLRRRPATAVRLAGFWELPGAELLPHVSVTREVGSFRHAITNTRYRCAVLEASLDGAARRRAPDGCVWVDCRRLGVDIPLTAASRKALDLATAAAAKRNPS